MYAAFTYARKSSEGEERQALSIPSQLEELSKLAQRDSLNIVEVLEESQSAKRPGRPIFNQMLDRIESGEANCLVVWNPDRLSRNSVDTGRIIYLMDLGKLECVVTPAQRFSSTPNDKFLFSLLCGQAKLENDNRGINAKRGMKTKAEMGWYPAPAPLGYTNNGHMKKGFRTITRDENFDLVQRCFYEILKGKQASEVWRVAHNEWRLTAKGGKPISHSTFYNLLTNPFYYGEYEWPKASGNWYVGKHEPMLSREQFDVVQKMLGKKGKPISRSHTFDLTGLLRCSMCGCAITATKKVKHYKRTGRTAEYVYYHCTKKNPKISCTQPPVSERDLEDAIMHKLIMLRPPEEFISWAKKWIKTVHEYESLSEEEVLSSQHRQIETIERQLSMLLDMRLQSDIDEETYKSKKSDLERRKKEAKMYMEKSGDNLSDLRFRIENALDIAYGSYLRFRTGSRDTKHEILMSIGSNLVLDQKKVQIDLLKHFEQLENHEKWREKFKDWLEPPKYTELFEKFPNLRPKNPVWLPR